MSFTPSHEVQMFKPFILFFWWFIYSFILIYIHLFISGCRGSLLLRGLLSSGRVWGPLSGCCVQASLAVVSWVAEHRL